MANLTLTGVEHNGPKRIPRQTIDYLGGEMAFSDAVVAFREAKQAHSKTVDVPAPIAHPLVEEVVNRYGAAFEVEEPVDPLKSKNERPFLIEDRDKLVRHEEDMKLIRERLEKLEIEVNELRESVREVKVFAGPDQQAHMQETLAAISARVHKIAPDE